MSRPQVIREGLATERNSPPPNDSVGELLAAVACGDRSAFDTLYCHFIDPVSRLVRLLMRDIALSEEVTQEVFLAVWLGARRFDPRRGDGGAWIIGIARSRAIDRIRSVQAARQRDRNYAAAADVSPVPTPDLVSARLDGHRVREALAVLTPKQRQAVLLAFFGGHTYQEIATLLDVPLPTVKSRIRDGLTRLRDHLESSGQGWPSDTVHRRPPFGPTVRAAMIRATLTNKRSGMAVTAGE